MQVPELASWSGGQVPPIRCRVEVNGAQKENGTLVSIDQHGFLVVLLDDGRFMRRSSEGVRALMVDAEDEPAKPRARAAARA